MKHHSAITYLGQIFTEMARDLSIVSHSTREHRAMKDPDNEFRTFIEALSAEQREQLHKFMIQATDDTLHNVLLMFEQAEGIRISVDTTAGTTSDIRDVAAGDLQGYVYIWAEEYSKEPLSHEP